MSTDIADLTATLIENDGATLAGRTQIARDKRASRLRHRKFNFRRVVDAANILGVEEPSEGDEFVMSMLVINFVTANLTRLALNAARTYGPDITPELKDDFARYMTRISPTVLGESDVWRISEALRSKQEAQYSEAIVLRTAHEWFNEVQPLGSAVYAFISRKDLVMDVER